MAHIARPNGTTLRRYEKAVVRPHHPQERFDWEFPVMMKCELCGEVGMAKRVDISLAMREHRESYCKARSTKVPNAEEYVTRIAYPWT